MQKLEPIMPKAVAHWRKTRDIASSELKELIEKQIISTAYQKLGDFHKEILLFLYCLLQTWDTTLRHFLSGV